MLERCIAFMDDKGKIDLLLAELEFAQVGIPLLFWKNSLKITFDYVRYNRTLGVRGRCYTCTIVYRLN